MGDPGCTVWVLCYQGVVCNGSMITGSGGLCTECGQSMGWAEGWGWTVNLLTWALGMTGMCVCARGGDRLSARWPEPCSCPISMATVVLAVAQEVLQLAPSAQAGASCGLCRPNYSS